MNRFPKLIACAVLALWSTAFAAITDGYTFINGNYFKTADGSGPYAIDSAGVATLISGGGGGGGGAVTNAGVFAVQPAGSVANDGGASAVNPILVGCYSSAAAPTNVSADVDATRAWCLRNGAMVIQTSFAGILASVGSGANGTGVQRVTIATDDVIIASLATKLDTLNTSINASNTQLPTALGQTTAAGSLAVVQASDATPTVAQGSTTSGQKGNLTQGAVTTVAPSYTTGQTSPLSLDTAGNLRVSGGATATSLTDTSRVPVDQRESAQVTGTTGSSAVLTNFPISTVGYQSILVQITSVGGGGTANFEASIDNVTFFPVSCHIHTNGGSASPSSTSTTTGLFKCPRYGDYFQVRWSGYVSGTPTAIAKATAMPQQQAIGANVSNTLVANVSGSVAENGTAPANPLVTGVEARTTWPTSATSGQSGKNPGTTKKVPIFRQDAIPEVEWNYAAAASGISNTTTAVTIKAAGTDRLYLRQVDLMCEALGTATEVAIRDGAAGTVLWRTKVGTGGLPLTSITFPNPKRGSAATLMEVVTLTASGTGACYVNASGYDAP